VGAEPLDGATQAVLDVDLRHPAQVAGRDRDVRTPDQRIVLRQCDKFDGRRGAGEVANQFRQLKDGKLVRVADVDWAGKTDCSNRTLGRSPNLVGARVPPTGVQWHPSEGTLQRKRGHLVVDGDRLTAIKFAVDPLTVGQRDDRPHSR